MKFKLKQNNTEQIHKDSPAVYGEFWAWNERVINSESDDNKNDELACEKWYKWCECERLTSMRLQKCSR